MLLLFLSDFQFVNNAMDIQSSAGNTGNTMGNAVDMQSSVGNVTGIQRSVGNTGNTMGIQSSVGNTAWRCNVS